MAQAGYINCSGCGRLFNAGSDDEMNLLLSHNCDDDSDDDE
jgi:hypothetical protein